MNALNRIRVEPGKTKPPRYPYMIEAKYRKVLTNLVDEVKTTALIEIRAHGEDIIKEADITYLRSDAISFGWASLLNSVIERIAMGIARGILVAAAKIEEISAEANFWHKRDWTRQVEQAYGKNRTKAGPIASIQRQGLREQNPFAVNILNNEPNLAGLLSAWEQENLSLIKSIPANLVEQLRNAFSKAFVDGTNLKDLTKIVIDRTDVSKSRATLIARDQIGKLNGKLSEIRQKAAGLDSYIWRTVGDERVRPKHRIRNNKQFNWSDKDIKPGEEIRCRCVADPVFPAFDLIK